tara:strand:- start:576 stop:1184 length:609 start_codon:yes stop_codon:yes gene_type:complete
MRNVISLLLSLYVSVGFADNASQTLQDKLNAIKTMEARFTQVVKAKGRELSNSSGNMALSRPGKFRWNTKEPMAQLVVADGDNLWVFDKELEQVTVKKQEQGIGGTAGLFLSGYNDNVSRDFSVTASQKGKTQVFDLMAKSKKENFQRVKLYFSGQALNRMEMYDQLGQHTIVKLSKIKTNPDLSKKLFKFKPPKGVDVVRQ